MIGLIDDILWFNMLKQVLKYLTISFLRFSSAQLYHSTALQFRLHSYGYAPYIAPCIALNLNTRIFKELIVSYLVTGMCRLSHVASTLILTEC